MPAAAIDWGKLLELVWGDPDGDGKYGPVGGNGNRRSVLMTVHCRQDGRALPGLQPVAPRRCG